MKGVDHSRNLGPMGWVHIRPPWPGVKMWGAFDGAASYVIAAALIQEYDYVIKGPYFTSVKKFSVRHDLGTHESLEEAKAVAEDHRMRTKIP